MLLISEDSKGTIEKYSSEFLRDFIELLRTTHGEKKVHLNQFYQQVISKKDHIHMNATKWSSLTQFAAYLGREGIARIEETEKGLFISWIDNSPETLRRREAIMKKERQDKGDEEREQRLIQEQIERAQAAAAEKSRNDDSEGPKSTLLERKEGEKVKLSFGSKALTAASDEKAAVDKIESASEETKAAEATLPSSKAPVVSFSSSTTTKPKNIFSAASTKSTGVVKSANPFANANKKSGFVPQQQKISQQEMIMRREMEAMEQKNKKRGNGNNNMFQSEGMKRQRVS